VNKKAAKKINLSIRVERTLDPASSNKELSSKKQLRFAKNIIQLIT
jgi:hypothetical protein